MTSTVAGLRIASTLESLGLRRDGEPTIDDIEALVGPPPLISRSSSGHACGRLIAGLPPDDPVRTFGEEKIRMLDDLGYASSKAEDDKPEQPRTRIGWDELPSSAPAARPLPRAG